MSAFATRLQNGTDTATRMRASDAMALTPNGAVRARGGLRPDNGGAVTVSAGTMTVNVAPLSAWVDSALSGQVGLPFVSDAPVALTIDAGHASLVRIDVVAIVVRENAFDSGGATSAAIEVVKGTPGAGVPALPNAAVPLRNISVHAGASLGTGGLTAANLSTDRRVWTTAAGGIVPVASATERDALVAVEGQAVYRRDTDSLQVYNGATWDSFQKVPTQDTWHAITPVNGYTASGNPEYRIDTAGNVHMRGRIGVGTSTNGAVAFTLPAGYRPTAASLLLAPVTTLPTTSTTGRLTVNSNGDVIFTKQTGTPTDFQLEGAIFSTL